MQSACHMNVVTSLENSSSGRGCAKICDSFGLLVEILRKMFPLSASSMTSAVVRRSWGVPGASWGGLGGVLGASWGILEASWRNVGHLGGLLEQILGNP